MSNHDPSPHEIQLVIGETVLAPPSDVTLAERCGGLLPAQSTSPRPDLRLLGPAAQSRVVLFEGAAWVCTQ